MEKPVFRLAFLHPRYWLLWLGMALLWLLVQLPYPLIVILAHLLTPLVSLLARSRRHIVAVNLKHCFPDETERARQRLLSQNFFSMTMALFETGMAWFWPRWRLRRIYRIEGLHNLPERPEQGVILMAMHFTTLDLGAAFLNQQRFVTGMYRPHKNPLYDYIQRKGRERHWSNCEVIPRQDVRGMIRALRNNSIVWYAPDQDYGRKQSVFAPFFGVPAASVTATAKFASLGRALVIPFVQYRLPGFQGYRVEVFAAIKDFPSGDEVADATVINGIVEACVRRQPDQYLWAHRRFKTRPEGAPSLYARK